MRSRRAALLLIAAILAVASLVACVSGTKTPAVVGTTPKPVEATPTAAPAPTPLAELAIAVEPVASGFEQPLFATGAGDGSGRLFVVEKTGRIWVLRDGKRSAAPFLDLSRKVSTQSEQGLLGLAFMPDFVESGGFVVNYTRADGATVISTFLARGDAADPATEHVLLTIPQPYANHNGGMVAFGPDGNLYVGMGDGGSGGDPHRNGQNLGVLLGKMLRLNVTRDAAETRDTPYGIPADNPFVGRAGARGEIWAYGLRNPWRFSFDRSTGDLWIADVGQDAWEEIDFQPASSAGGQNYGWNVYEGTHTYPPNSPAPANPSAFTMPVLEYDHSTGESITGGYVYRGSAQKPLWGTYIYGDFTTGSVYGAQRSADGAVRTRLLLDTGAQISSFGEDDAGELYVIDLGGAVYRVVVARGK